jgi:RnfABCDGE-type electron transport complex D subunit
MKMLLKIFEKVSPAFEEGGKFSTFKPVYKAMENFFFAPSVTTPSAPYARDPLDIKRLMSMVIIALMPAFLVSIYFFGLRIITMLIVSYTVGGAVEIAFAIIRKEEINEGFLVTGMIFPLILPPMIPLWMVVFGVAFGVFVGKEIFGGTGRNIFNPALVGRCFLALAYPANMAGKYIRPGNGFCGRIFEYITPSGVDAISQATPLALAKQGNLTDFSDMFLGSIAGSFGETSAIAVIIGGVFLLLTRVSNWRTVSGALVSSALTAALLHHVAPERFAPVLWHLCAGGLLFGIFFMATDPVSSPVTNAGKWIYGGLIGIITMLIRNFTGYVEGVTFAILLGMTVTDQFTYPYKQANASAERVSNILAILKVSVEADVDSTRLIKIFNTNVFEGEKDNLTIYSYRPAGQAEVEAFAFPFSGTGLWGPIKGFLALESDLKTIRGISFYEQKETPGLGGEIGSSDWFQSQFEGKSIVDQSGKPGITISKSRGKSGQSQIDGITGATMTCDKVENILNKVINTIVEE